jgi:putative nucleotidyltransferase with HDIG domain
LEPEIRTLCPGWRCDLATEATGALRMADLGAFDLIIAEENLVSGGGLQVLDVIWERESAILRFLHSTVPDQELAMRCVWKSHRLMTGPLTAESIHDAVHRAEEVQAWLGNENAQRLVERLRTFPIIPSLYFRVVKEVASPDATIEIVARLIEEDMAVSTKIIQVVNSPWYGMPHQISDLREAVQMLGFDTVKALVLAVQLMTEEDRVKPLYDIIRDVWRHSLSVAVLARRLAAEFDPDDPVIADEAYTAGLLHDLGKVILESNLGEKYHGALDIAKERRLRVFQVEAFCFGANHAEVAAHLAALWGLPRRVVEAIALHHAPSRAKDTAFSPLTAIHIANVLDHEITPDKDGLSHSELDLGYLARLGIADKIDLWRATLTPAAEPAQSGSAQVNTPTKPVTGPHDSEPLQEQVPIVRPDSRRMTRRLAIVVVGVAMIAFLAGSRKTLAPKIKTWWSQSGFFQKRTGESAGEDRRSTTETNPGARPENKSTGATRNRSGLKLEAVFKNQTRPAALINGQTVFIGELIGDAKITAISSNSVRISINGEERTLEMP